MNKMSMAVSERTKEPFRQKLKAKADQESKQGLTLDFDLIEESEEPITDKYGRVTFFYVVINGTKVPLY